ncbi:MAG: hypothetical protein AAFN63_18520 [Pseudomonadota bacterium]
MFDRFATLERLVILGLLVLLSIAALFFIPSIFEVFPVCVETQNCPYRVPIYTAEVPPKIVWHSPWKEFATFAADGEYEMQTIFEAELSGRLRDPMMASGLFATFVVLWLSLPLDRLFNDMMDQLEHDQLVPANIEERARIENLRRLCARVLGGVMAVLLGVFTMGYFDGEIDSATQFAFLFGNIALGLIAGHRLGSAIAYGEFSRKFTTNVATIRILPGHADRMGGWQRVGEFFAYEFVLMSVPIIWLTSWIYILFQRPRLYWTCFKSDGLSEWPERLTGECSQPPVNAYMGWVHWQILLLIISLFILWFAFLRPFLDTVKAYRRKRSILVSRYQTTLSEPLESAVMNYEMADDISSEMLAIETISKLSGLRHEVRMMPALPMRGAFTGVFSLSAFYPLIMISLTVLMPEDDAVGGVIGLIVDYFNSAS